MIMLRSSSRFIRHHIGGGTDECHTSGVLPHWAPGASKAFVAAARNAMATTWAVLTCDGSLVMAYSEETWRADRTGGTCGDHVRPAVEGTPE
ncbi:hypothetical protein NDU88_009118 [Pleurodeles waltl]|uniref:Uncharacterized protein n=1 Tax=Pleurodeles waltl TaxID=8319 RepID=A0AAV7RVP0_PLEWA|nr:hypothetical protein NDU88_009118 [Pleurodeles waltl]